MTEGFHHSVSNKLFLDVDPLNISYLIGNRDLKPLQFGKFPLLDAHQISQLLATNQLLHQIYGTVDVIYSGAPFVLLPSEITDPNNRKDIFSLSHTLKASQLLLEDNLNQHLAICYAVERDLHEVFMTRYPNVRFSHEVTNLFTYLNQVVKPESPMIMAYLTDERLALFAARSASPMLVNYFDCKSMDDAFYFIMSVVEQLELEPESTEMLWLSNQGTIDYGNVESTFRPYIAKVHLRQVAGEELIQIGMALRAVVACA